MKSHILIIGVFTVVTALSVGSVNAADINSVIAGYSGNANAANGKAIFLGDFTGKQGPKGKVETPKCTTCHDPNPKMAGRTRTGKEIGPMAVSSGYKDPDTGMSRFMDEGKREKWFFRNCRGVIGRECTAQEKADFLAFMASQ